METPLLPDMRGRLAMSGLTLASLLFCPLVAMARDKDDNRTTLTATVVSSEPERVSGGDALIEIAGRTVWKSVSVKLNGVDVSRQFQVADGKFIGLIKGLKEGRNIVAVRDGKGRRTSLVLTNYPISGPIFSGPQVEPYVCQTENFALPDGSYLGKAIDAKCTAPTKVIYLYKSATSGRFQPMTDLTKLPPDVASITTKAGATVPYVVRFEAGTIDRGVYNIAILQDPTKESATSAVSPPAGWARRLLWVHGFGCPGGWYHQGTNTGSLDGLFPPGPRQNTIEANFNVMNDAWLSRGYAIATSTLNHPSISCNPVVAAEATAMVKEHFIEQYGAPHFTLSTGSSGGAYSSLQIADAYPGLFDGVLIGSVFPDTLSIALSGLDGHLLTHYFAVTNPAGFTEAQQVAISGYAGRRAFLDAANQAGRADPVSDRKDVPGYVSGQWTAAGAYPVKQAVPVDLRYDPAKNPKGARPTIFDVSAAVYGKDTATGAALRPFDNVGVQYGLDALNTGLITASQFLDLNEKIGGYDRDANYVSDRSAADRKAVERAYRGGMILAGSGGLASVPIFDYAGYKEDAGYHYQSFRFAVRERLKAATGNADNHVMWRTPSVSLQATSDAITMIDDWMDSYRSAALPIDQRSRVVQNRPRELTDACSDKSDPAKLLREWQIFGEGPNSRCNQMWPSYRNPRMVAGGPLASDVLKCALKPIDQADYKIRFSKNEYDRLRAIFASGVCDWSKPGVFRGPMIPWTSYGPSPVNRIRE